MTTALAGAVELLDRSLSYTRVALAEVADVPGATPTPCRGWPVTRLLHHMDDALDAYTEAATGSVSLVPTTDRPRLELIRAKACALLGWWVDHPVGPVGVGDRWLPAEVLVGAAALEITVHGWDLRVAAGRPVPVPLDLARPLVDVARQHAGPAIPCLAPRATNATPVTGVTESAVLLRLCGRG